MEIKRKWWQYLAILQLFLCTANGTPVTPISLNCETNNDFRSISDLRMEARSEENGLDLVTFKTATNLPELRTTESSKVQGNANIMILGKSRVMSSGDKKSRMNVKVLSDDSYLKALKYSHSNKNSYEGVRNINSKPKVIKLSRREYSPGPVYQPEQEYGPPNEVFYSSDNGHETAYDASHEDSYSKDSFSLPTPPSMNANKQVPYGSHHIDHIYEFSNWEPPSYPPSAYEPTVIPHPPQMPSSPGETRAYSIPHALDMLPTIDLSWPFMLKLNAFTLAKILLKLVFFKIIVKFIAVICLLLFIPKLNMKKHENDETEDEKRSSVKSNSSLQYLNLLTATVLNAIEEYENLNKIEKMSKDSCSTIWCRIRRALTYGESWQDYVRLFKNYVSKEQALTDSTKRN